LEAGGRPISSTPASVVVLTPDHTLACMSMGVAIALGAGIGLALGIVIGLTTDVPLAPEVGLVLGALVGWLFRRDGA
jgi:hypothetical protein